MVMQSPCKRPAFNSTFSTCGMPPARCRSVATYWPDGFRSHSTGTLRRIRSKSSIVHSTSAACAIARKCSTALVEPPVAMISATAFSIDLRVTMSRGLRSFFTASISTRADSAAESVFSRSGLAIVEEPSRLMPSASNAEDMVFAVYMPPQEPVPGTELRSMPSKSSWLIRPWEYSPTASKIDTMVKSLPFHEPGRIVPPYT